MTNSRNKLRLGVVGCGRVTETLHLPALQNLPDAEVVAVADISKDRATKVADLFHIKDRYTDYQRLLKDPSIDLVAVCVPAEFHVEVASSALEVGKHVFVEKPLALEMAQTDLLVEQAKKSSCKITVGFNLRWHRLVREAREIIQRGTLGRLEIMRTVLTSHHDNVPGWRKHREMGGGVLFEQAVHHFDLWRYLLQSEVEEVFATSRSERWDDESATVTARMANGVLAASVFSERTVACDELEIYGATHRLRVDCYRFDGLEYVSSAQAPGSIRSRIRKIANTLWDLPRGISKIRHGGDFIVSYRAEWRHFIDCIHRGAEPECTLEDGRRALQVVLAVIESSSLGEPVRVAQAPCGIASTAALPGVRNELAENAALARKGN